MNPHFRPVMVGSANHYLGPFHGNLQPLNRGILIQSVSGPTGLSALMYINIYEPPDSRKGIHQRAFARVNATVGKAGPSVSQP